MTVQDSPQTSIGAGREPAVTAIVRWLEDRLRPRLCMVTGAPGCGKTRTTVWAVVSRRSAVHATISGRGLTPQTLAWALADQLSVTGGAPHEVVEQIAADRRPATVVVTELDESGFGLDGSAAFALVEEVLAPLLQARHVRLLVEGRREFLTGFAAGGEVIDLDRPELTDREEFGRWLRATAAARGTADPGRIAAAEEMFPNVGAAELALSAGRGEWPDSIPWQARPAVEALGFAHDSLEPAAWRELTAVLLGDRWQAQQSVEAARALVARTGDDRYTVSRVVRQAVRGRRTPEAAVQIDQAFTRALHAAVPRSADGRIDWARADRYTARHLLRHAAAGGTLERLLDDVDLLLHARAETVVAAFDAVDGDWARRQRRVWRSAGAGCATAPVPDRAALLRLAAVRHHDEELAERYALRAAEADWDVRWALTRPPAGEADRWPGAVSALERGRGRLAGHVLAVAADGPLHVLSPADGSAAGRIRGERTDLRGLVSFPDGTLLCLDSPGFLSAVGAPRAESRSEMISSLLNAAPASASGIDATAFVKAVGAPRPFTALGADEAVTRIVCGDHAGTLHVWNLDSDTPTALEHTLHRGPITAATCVRGASPISMTVSGGADGRLVLWRPGDPREPREAMHRPTRVVAVDALLGAGGPLIAAAWADGMVVVWDMVAGITIRFIVGFPIASLLLAADEVLLVAGEHGVTAFDLRRPEEDPKEP